MSEKTAHKEILIVDDDPDYSLLTQTRLQAAGYQVSHVSNGAEAMKFLDHCRPDLIILDIEMPERNGLTTLVHLNVTQKEKRIPVVVATGLQSDQVQAILTSYKVDGYLKKPYASEDLIQIVTDTIGESDSNGKRR